MSKTVPPDTKRLIDEAVRDAIRPLTEQQKLLSPFIELLREILRPGTATRDAWDIINPYNAGNVRMAAALNLAGKVENPIYRRRRNDIREDLYKQLEMEWPVPREWSTRILV